MYDVVVIFARAQSMYGSPACRDEDPVLAGLPSSGRQDPLITIVFLKRTTLRSFKIEDGCQSGNPLWEIVPGVSSLQAVLEQDASNGFF